MKTLGLLAVLLLLVSGSQAQPQVGDAVVVKEYDLSFARISGLYMDAFNPRRLPSRRIDRSVPDIASLYFSRQTQPEGRASFAVDALEEILFFENADQAVSFVSRELPFALKVRIGVPKSHHERVELLLQHWRRRVEARVRVSIWQVDSQRELLGAATERLGQPIIIGSVSEHACASTLWSQGEDGGDCRVPRSTEIGFEFQIQVLPRGDGTLWVTGSYSERRLKEMREVPTQSGLTLTMPWCTERYAPFGAVVPASSNSRVKLFGRSFEIQVDSDYSAEPVLTNKAGHALYMCDLAPAMLPSPTTSWLLNEDLQSAFWRPESEDRQESGSSSNAAVRLYDELNDASGGDNRPDGKTTGYSAQVLCGWFFALGSKDMAGSATSRSRWQRLISECTLRSLNAPDRFRVSVWRCGDLAGDVLVGEHEFSITKGGEADWFDVDCIDHVWAYGIPTGRAISTREPWVQSAYFGTQIRLRWDGECAWVRVGRREATAPVVAYDTGLDGGHDIVIEHFPTINAEVTTSGPMGADGVLDAAGPIGEGSLKIAVTRLR